MRNRGRDTRAASRLRSFASTRTAGRAARACSRRQPAARRAGQPQPAAAPGVDGARGAGSRAGARADARRRPRGLRQRAFIGRYLADDDAAIERDHNVQDWNPDATVAMSHGRDDRTVSRGIHGPWLCPRAVRAVRPRLPDRLLVQGAWRVPLVQRPAHGGDRGASDRSRPVGVAPAPVGARRAEVPALPPAARPQVAGRCRKSVPARGGILPARAQPRFRPRGATRRDRLHPPLRRVAQCPPVFQCVVVDGVLAPAAGGVFGPTSFVARATRSDAPSSSGQWCSDANHRAIQRRPLTRSLRQVEAASSRTRRHVSRLMSMQYPRKRRAPAAQTARRSTATTSEAAMNVRFADRHRQA